MRKKAYLLGRDMIWARSAERYMESFDKARRERSHSRRRPLLVRTLGEQPGDLPAWQFDHLRRMTDSTGMFQHAFCSIPKYEEGYCTDDNARALLLSVHLEELGMEEEVASLAPIYAAFVNYALNPANGLFRNFMGYDRRWLEAAGSEDSHSRALWSLGACVGRSRNRDLQFWAAQTFEAALPAVLEFVHPRGWVFALLGIDDYIRRLKGDRRTAQIREILSDRLLTLYDQNAEEDWPWFEDLVSYDNARLPQALILSGEAGNNARAVEVGLHALRWLAGVQTAPQGHFRPIGSNGFYKRGAEPAQFGQQALEAWATVSACLTAHRITDEPAWVHHAQTAFEWFLGRNDLGVALYDPVAGGCRDGLHADRMNPNQGAESTLAFLLSLAEMKVFRSSVSVFRTMARSASPSNGRTRQTALERSP
jgi:hypothetical protein